jgi:ribosomal protein S18 acetylase RimI-like enzyme
VKDILHNPVYNALLTGDHHFSLGNDQVKYFDERVSPFVGFDEDYTNGFSDLFEILPSGRRILYAAPNQIKIPDGWQLQHQISGLQFIYEGEKIKKEFPGIVPLAEKNIEEMMQLVSLTRPGPFGPRTIEFGHYYGIFDNDKLVAMTGQRLHVQNWTEISAVCTHPDHTGKGYAFALMQHQLQLIMQDGERPFLHVREDNERAIALYQRMGFIISRPMIFYFMKKL